MKDTLIMARAKRTESSEGTTEVLEEAADTTNGADESQNSVDEGELTVHDHLLDAARATDPNFKSMSSREKSQNYFKRLLSAVSEAPQDAWGSLPEEAQSWFNDNADRMKAEEEISPPDGFVAPATNGGQPRRHSNLGTKTPRGPSAVAAIQRYLVNNPGAKNAEVIEHLTASGLEAKESTIMTTRTSTLSILTAVKEAGHWAE